MKTVELTHICMTQSGDTGKTLTWDVRTKSESPKDPRGEGGRYLGHIQWFGRWRGYAFFPELQTIYEQKCLREIADFIEGQTKAHRAKKAAERKKKR